MGAPTLSLRAQLLAVFGLLAAGGIALLVADEISQSRTQRAQAQLLDESLAGVRRMMAVFDAYGIEIAGAAWKVERGQMGWQQASHAVESARMRIGLHWRELAAGRRDRDQQAVFEQIDAAHREADIAVERLVEILRARDRVALHEWTGRSLEAVIDPVTSRLRFLSDLELIGAERLMRDEDARLTRLRLGRVLAFVALLAVVGWVGRGILRNVHGGVDSLLGLAQALQRRDFGAVPRFQPRGELGELQQAFLATREAIRSNQEELRRSEARAQEANLAKSAFLAAMSHEIRTPMIGVTGMVEVLAHSRLDPAQRRALNIIQHSARHLLQVLGDILDVSKIEADRLELAPQPLDLRRLLGASVASFLGSASSKGLSLALKVDPALAPAHRGDPLRLRQVLANLLSNAIKFTDHGGIAVELEVLYAVAAGQRIRVRVEDSGIGIAPEAQAALFQPFAQADGSTARRFGGTGLGLYICKRLVELMGGRIVLHSEPGRGTRVELEVELDCVDPGLLPAEPADSEPVTPTPWRSAPDPRQAEAERSLVLLVDDHPTNREVIGRQLALAGFACESVDNGEQGLQAWRSGRFALLLSDLHMPDLDGYGLAAAIRAEEARQGRERTPIIALTAAAMQGEAERCLQAGMDDYLSKPVSIASLGQCLRRWLPHLQDAPASAVPASAPDDLLHWPGLLDLAAGDRAAAIAILDDYLASSAGDLAQLRHAQAMLDAPVLQRTAHRIKGAARLIGAAAMADAAERIERAARDGELADAAHWLADLHTALHDLQRLRHALNEH